MAASKYDEVVAVVGRKFDFNDERKLRVTGYEKPQIMGRILKYTFYRLPEGQSRDEHASIILQKLIDAGAWYVEKVEVKKATDTCVRFNFSSTINILKLCIYVDKF